MLIAHNLSKHFDNITALDGVSFEVNPNTIVGLLGPNGAGKSTLVRLLAGVMKPDEGTAELFGYDLIEDTMNVKYITGILPEEYALYEKLTVFEYIQFIASLYDIENIRDKYDEFARKLGIYELTDRLIETLSKGQKQKVALMAAFIHEPKVIFLDEPMANLDVRAQKTVKNIIRENQSESKIIMIATHLMQNIEDLCNYLLIINHGKIIFQGEMKEFMGNYSSLEDAYLNYVSD